MTLVDALPKQNQPRSIYSPVTLIFWLLVHPSAWRSALQMIDPQLPADFCLACLSRPQWKNVRLVGFILFAWISQSILVPVFTSIVLFIVGGHPQDILHSAIVASGYIFSATMAAAFLTSFGSALVLGAGLGAGITLLAGQTDYFFFPIAVASGLAGAAQLNLSHSQGQQNFSRNLAGLVSGFLVTLGIVAVFYGITSGKLAGSPQAPEVGEPIGFELVPSFLLLVLPLAFASVLGGLKLRTSLAVARLWKIALGMALLAMLGYLGLLTLPASNPLLYSAAGLSGGIFISMLFGMAWSLADRFGGPHAAAVASALVAGIGWMPLAPYVVMDYDYIPENTLLTIGLLLGAFTISLWRPVLLFPLAVIWNNLLYTLDLRRPNGPLRYFWRHAAFWDERQRLTWPGLDDYLLLLSERESQRFPDTMLYLSVGGQRRAVQQAELELSARQLESCRDIQTLASCYRLTVGRSLSGLASNLLATFARISQDTERALRQASDYQSRLQLGLVRDQLSNLKRELVLSNDHLARRFTRVAAHWYRLVTDHLEMVARHAQATCEIENPYICGIPLSDQQSLFVGRTDIMARIESLLLEGHRPPVLLYGQRRMGKTSLLLNLSHFLSEAIVPCYVDGQSLAGMRDVEEILPHALEKVRQSAGQQRNLELPPLDISGRDESLFLRITRWIELVENLLEQRDQTLLFMLDEFEALESSMAANLSSARMYLGLARHVVQHHPRFKILLTGAHTFDETRHWAEFLINAQMVKVGYLHPQEALQLIEYPVQNFSLAYSADASRRILELTRCHPLLVQSLCFEMVALKNEQPPPGRFTATLEDVEEAARRSLVSNTFFFQDVRQTQITPAAAAMLDVLAAQGDCSYLSTERWRQSCRQNFEENLALLLKRDLVEPYQDGYRLQIELVRAWFSRQIEGRRVHSSSS